MTFNVGKIEGGTRAGWRTVNQTPKDWSCPKCLRDNKRYRPTCDCGEKRDGSN